MRFVTSLCLGMFCLIELSAIEVILSKENSVESVIDVDPSTPINEIYTHVENHEGAPVENIQLIADYKTAKRSASKKLHRDYNEIPSKEDVENLNYIIKTLATKNPIQLAFSSSELNDRGDKIMHLHPLKFLTIILTDPDNLKYVKAIRDKTLAWNGFIRNLRKSLKEETDKHNLTYEQVADFSNVIGVDVNLLWPDIENKRWTAFTDKAIYQARIKK